MATKKKKERIYQCAICGFRYREKKWKEKCETWCRKYRTCNLEVIKHAVK